MAQPLVAARVPALARVLPLKHVIRKATSRRADSSNAARGCGALLFSQHAAVVLQAARLMRRLHDCWISNNAAKQLQHFMVTRVTR